MNIKIFLKIIPQRNFIGNKFDKLFINIQLNKHKMNTFSSIKPEINDEEINGEKKYRNIKKKIRRLNEKDLLTEEQEEKLKILRILVEEYESRHKGVPKKKPQSEKKKKKKLNNKEEEDFLNKEYEKNKDYWKKKEREDIERELRQKWEREQKERERKLKEEWEREQKEKDEYQQRRKREEKHKREQKEYNYNYQNQYYNYTEKSEIEKFSENYDINVPKDIEELYINYTKQKYRELALKYHPDKSDKNIEYQKMLNNIKDIN